MTTPAKPASPLPWTVESNRARIEIHTGPNKSIALPHSAQQDAEYIVQACNAFPALYAALEKMLSLRCIQAVETIARASVHSEKEKPNRSMEIVTQARAALALARGEKGETK